MPENYRLFVLRPEIFGADYGLTSHGDAGESVLYDSIFIADDFPEKQKVSILECDWLRMKACLSQENLALAIQPWLLEKELENSVDFAIVVGPHHKLFGPITPNEWDWENKDLLVNSPFLSSRPPTVGGAGSGGIQGPEAPRFPSIIAVNQTSGPFLGWWKNLVLEDIYSANPRSLFGEQTWFDVIRQNWKVGTINDASVCSAPWTIAGKKFSSRDGRWFVGDDRLALFNFDGFNPEKPWVVSEKLGNASPKMNTLGEAQLFFSNRAEELLSLAKDDAQSVGPPPDVSSCGLRLNQEIRDAIRQELAVMPEHEPGQVEIPDLYGDASEVERWLMGGTGSDGIPRIMKILWKARPDVQQVFPRGLGRDYSSLISWLRDFGATEHGISQQLVEEVEALERSLGHLTPFRGIHITTLPGRFGLGALGRVVKAAAQQTDIPTKGLSFAGHAHIVDGEELNHQEFISPEYSIIAMNADTLLGFSHSREFARLRNSHKVGLWAWELEVYPSYFQDAAELVDEIWTISNFITNNLSKITPKKVSTFPIGMDYFFSVPGADPLSPLSDKIRAIPPYFLFNFDYMSVFERKNPTAAVDAFRDAFGDDPERALVLKTNNSWLDPERAEYLRYFVRNMGNVHLIEDSMTWQEIRFLFERSLGYISLHRSEGFGLGMAEAMSIGKPVIGTAYSGNLDFMTESNSILIGFSSLALKPEAGQYFLPTTWAEPDINEASKALRSVVEQPESTAQVAVRGRETILRDFTLAQSSAFMRKHYRATVRKQWKRFKSEPE